MNVNKLLQKTKTAFEDFAKQIQADMLEFKCQTSEEKPNPYTTCKANNARDTIIIEDVSGSMGDTDYHPTRLKGGIQAAIEYINARTEHCYSDRLALIVFNHTARIICPLTSIKCKEKLTGELCKLDADGGTDISKGLKKAIEIFSKELSCGNERQIILLTDGHGGNPVKKATRLEQAYGTVIDVVGIGGTSEDVNEELLRKIATTDPDGFNHYQFIKDSNMLIKHYRKLATNLVWQEKNNDKS